MKIKYSYNNETNGYEVVDISGDGKFIYIPDYENDAPVTKICTGAFNRVSDVESISIPSSIREIGENVFRKTCNLQVVFYRGSIIDANELEIKRGNCYLLSANNMIALGDYHYVETVLNRMMENHDSMLAESEDVFVYQPIQYLRTAFGQWLNENEIKHQIIVCDETDFSDPIQNVQCVVLDSIDYVDEDEVTDKIQNIINICKERKIMVIALANRVGNTPTSVRRLFKHKICFNNEEKLYNIAQMLKKEKRVMITTLQIKLSIGFVKAKELMQQLVDKGYVEETENGYKIVDRSFI